MINDSQVIEPIMVASSIKSQDIIQSTSHATSASKEDDIVVPSALLSHLNHSEESFLNPVTEVSEIVKIASQNGGVEVEEDSPEP